MSDENRDRAKPGQHKFSDFFYNPVSYVGVVLALFILISELFLFAIDFFSGHGSNVYLGIFTYVILPVFLIIGLLLIPAGALLKRRKVLKGLADSKPESFYIDPSLPTHRNAIAVFIIGTTIFLIMTAVGSYKAFQYTESVHFCGITCHKIMKPEYTAYLNSPHARVKCVECHIGEGADWYLRSKLSGVRQIYHAIKGDYSRPIPTPVHNLRPAKETCERCHWPDKLYSSLEVRRNYFSAYGSEKPEWYLRMLVNVGNSGNKNEGIHSHMYVDHDIFFAAEDERLQEISWVKSVAKNGEETVYMSPDSKWKDQPPPPEAIHKMDCMDCHNRPTHNYNPPNELLNRALSENQIDPSLPSIKSKAMELLSGAYATEDEAVAAIREKMGAFYKEQLGDEYGQNQPKVEAATEKIVDLFKTNMFPEMKTRWDAFPDNIGHMTSSGCFRCHDNEHATETGKVISRDCTICHTIIEQGPPDAVEKSTEGLPFVHPFEDDGLWQDMNCHDCHTGN